MKFAVIILAIFAPIVHSTPPYPRIASKQFTLISPYRLMELKSVLKSETFWKSAAEKALGHDLIPYDYELIRKLGLSASLPQLKYVFEHMHMSAEDQYNFIDKWAQRSSKPKSIDYRVIRTFIDSIDIALPFNPNRPPLFIHYSIDVMGLLTFMKLVEHPYFFQWINADMTGQHCINSGKSLAHGIFDYNIRLYLATNWNIDVKNEFGQTPLMETFDFYYSSGRIDKYLAAALKLLECGANFSDKLSHDNGLDYSVEDFVCQNDPELGSKIRTLIETNKEGQYVCKILQADKDSHFCQLPTETLDLIIGHVSKSLMPDIIATIRSHYYKNPGDI